MLMLLIRCDLILMFISSYSLGWVDTPHITRGRSGRDLRLLDAARDRYDGCRWRDVLCWWHSFCYELCGCKAKFSLVSKKANELMGTSYTWSSRTHRVVHRSTEVRTQEPINTPVVLIFFIQMKFYNSTAVATEFRESQPRVRRRPGKWSKRQLEGDTQIALYWAIF